MIITNFITRNKNVETDTRVFRSIDFILNCLTNLAETVSTPKSIKAKKSGISSSHRAFILKVSNNELTVFAGNPCETKAQTSD